jgi:helicase
LRLDELPLPTPLVELLTSQGYQELYPTQEAAVRAGVLEGRNLLVTSPTASGKTLIAIMAAGKQVLEEGVKAIYLTPLRALAAEKYGELRALEALKLGERRLRVALATGDYDRPGEELGQADILVLTNEKFDSLLRHNPDWIDQVGLFVADEIHLAGEPRRGPTLEVILSKIRCYMPEAQVLGLSATVTNARELAEWLGAELVDVKWRPVPLKQGIYLHGEVWFDDGERHPVPVTGRGVPIDLAVDVLRDGGQALIFAETRKRAVSLALKAAEVVPKHLAGQEQERCHRLAEEASGRGEVTELSKRLVQALRGGVAFHHAGLGPEHRRLVEEAFREGVLKVVVSTPTLAMGVNLPARRVVIASLMRYDAEYGGNAPITVLDYLQMCGRAGRPKYDRFGETVIIAPGELEAEDLYHHYIKGVPEPIRSQLVEPASLRFHLLATLASMPGMSLEDVEEFIGNTLLAHQYRPTGIRRRVRGAIHYLLDSGLIEAHGRRYLATEFGARVSQLYIDPATGVLFRSALEVAGEGGRHTAGILHLVAAAPDFHPQLALRRGDWEVAEEYVEARAEEFLMPLPEAGQFEAYEEFLAPLRTVFVLEGWMEEWSEARLLERFGVEPGDLHRAVESADWLLYSLGEVAKLVGRLDLLREIDLVRRRVRHGVREELLPLVSLEGVGRVRARALYNAGFKSLADLARASEQRLAEVPTIGAMLAKSIKRQVGQQA